MVTAQLSPTRRKAIARWARAQLARRSLAKFAQQAVAAGVVEGTPRLEWGPHLEAHAWDLQMQFESWIVANGPDPGTAEFAEWAEARWEMIARQKAAWERTGAVWEDRKPAPWLRYVLVQNTIDNLPPSCWKSSMAMICANAWIWLWDPTFSFGALSGMDANVGRDSRATRELIRSDWYRETFEITWTDNDLDDKTGEPASVGIRRDMDAIEAWGTTAGGKRISRTATRGLTGVHVDCLVGETLVSTEVGDVAIADLVAMSPMPRVWSMNHDTGALELAGIRAWRRIENRTTVTLETTSGQVLRCTPNHRVYADDEYRPASDCAGRRVALSDGTAVVSAVTASARAAVYDIEVERNHNFFAGGLLVHNCILYDDPDDADNVYSEAERLKPQNRWTRVIENRINDERRSIRRMMQQVVHPEGMTWYLRSLSRWSPQTPTGWAQFCIPAEFGFGPSDAPTETPWGWKDWRSEKGDTIHPRLSAGVLAVIKTKHSAYEAQYNQNAEAVGDGMIARTDVRFFVWEHEARTIGLLKARPQECIPRNKLPPVIIKPSDLRDITLSVDAANSLNPKPGAKISAVGLVVGACHVKTDDRFILDDQTRVLGVSATYRAVFDVLARWQIERVLVELKALGAGVIEELELAIRRGWFLDNETDEKIELLGPDGRRVRCEVEQVKVAAGEDKVQRAHGMLPSWESHQMHVHDGAEWLYPRSDEATRRTVDDGYIGEICGFPKSRKSDRVDATSQFVARYRATSDPREEWRAMRRLALVGGRR